MTANKGSFVKQAAILAAASILVRLIGFAYRVPLTDLLGDEGNAFYSTAYYVYAFAIVLSSGAIPAAISKLVSERVAVGRFHDAHELFKTAMGAAAVLGATLALVMALGANWLAVSVYSLPGAVYAIRALAPTIFVVALIAVFRGYFQGMNTMMPTAFSQVFEQIFNVIFSVWLAHVFFRAAGGELAGVGFAEARGAAGAAAGTGIGAVAGLIVVVGVYLLVAGDLRNRAATNARNLPKNGREKREAQLKALAQTALPIIVSMGIYQVATLIDIGMATNRITASGAFSDVEVAELVGQFTGKFLLLTALPVSLSLALSQAVIPDISSAKATMDFGAFKHKINTALRISMALSLPAVVGLTVLSDPILALLFPNYPDGGWLLRYGAVSIIFLALVQISSGVLQGIGKMHLPIIAAAVGVAVKIPVNWVLLARPEINIMGTVISTIVCYVIAAFINLYFLHKHTGVFPDYAGAFVKPTFAAIGMGLVSFVVHHIVSIAAPDRVATMVALLVAVPVYLVFMWMIGGFRKQDVDAMPFPKAVRKWFNAE